MTPLFIGQRTKVTPDEASVSVIGKVSVQEVPETGLTPRFVKPSSETKLWQVIDSELLNSSLVAFLNIIN